MAAKRKNELDLTLHSLIPLETTEERNSASPPLKKKSKIESNDGIFGNSNEQKDKFHSGNILEDKEKFQTELSKEDFTLLHELSSGCFAVVQKVRHKPSNIIMARKRMRPECNMSSKERTMFELNTLQECNCPFIVRCYGYTYDDSVILLYTEYMDGGSMDSILQRTKKIPENILSVVTLSVLKGLKYLSDVHSLVHRGIKPSNILVNLRGEVKLSDVGLGILAYQQRPFDCSHNKIKCYTSPARISDVSPASLDSDLWSLGISLIELATGKYPYQDNEKLSVYELLDRIIKEKPPKLRDDCFTYEFSNFIDYCLKTDANVRKNFEELEIDPWIQNAVQDYDKVDISRFIYQTVVECDMIDEPS